jgi:hypothetical protein
VTPNWAFNAISEDLGHNTSSARGALTKALGLKIKHHKIRRWQVKHMLAVSTCLLGLCTSALAAVPARVQFVGSLQQDENTPVTFDIQIPSGQTAKLELADGHVLAFSTAGSTGHPGSTTVILSDASGKQLHSQTIPDASLASMSFAYLICNGETRFMSPSPAASPSCSRQ